MIYLIAVEYDKALLLLLQIKNPDHLVTHYTGVCLAKLQQTAKAYHYFMKALQLNPEYEEPLEQLKALGCGINFHTIDPAYYMYK